MKVSSGTRKYISADEDGNLSASLRIDPNDKYWKNDMSYRVVSAFLVDSENNSRFYVDRLESDFFETLGEVELDTFTVDAFSPPVIIPADYSGVESAISSIPVDLNNYESEGVTNLRSIVDSVIYNKSEMEQPLVNNYAANIKKAIDNLVLKKADYSILDSVLEKIPEDLSIYTTGSVMDLESVLSSIIRDLDITEQEKVDGFSSDLEKAIEELDEKNKPQTPETFDHDPSETGHDENDRSGNDIKNNGSGVTDAVKNTDPPPVSGSVPKVETKASKIVTSKVATPKTSLSKAAIKNTPMTGDNNTFALWGTAGISSIAMAAIAIIKRKREKH